MSIRKKAFVSEEYYHIYNRGNSKQKIFHDKEDHYRFISLLYACNSENNFRIYALNKIESPYDFKRDLELVSIGAYCLMPNHFHILITQTEKGDISKFMQKLSTAYVMYYNKKYKRTGGLFEGKFKAEHVDEDRYLKYLFSYIHLNSIKLIVQLKTRRFDKNVQQTEFFAKKTQFSYFLLYLFIVNEYLKFSFVRYIGWRI